VTEAGSGAPVPAPLAPVAPRFPYSNWGPRVAILGLLAAIGLGIMLGVPAVVIDQPGTSGDLGTGANIAVQIATAIGFIAVPLFVASRGGVSLLIALRRLGVRRFRAWTALKGMAVAIGAYFLFAVLYTMIAGEPEQDEIAEAFGPVPVQILLVVFLASVGEELCFRGMLFGGLRERLPSFAAALLSGAIFGALHAVTGLSAVPPLIAFGTIMALLYERTGSIVPCMVLHGLNNSAALLAQ